MSPNDKLQQAWFKHTCLQLDQIGKLVEKLQQANKIDNKQQVFGVLAGYTTV